jgi:hypothetical protein
VVSVDTTPTSPMVVGHTILDVDTAERFVKIDYVSDRSLSRAKQALRVYTRLFGKHHTLRIASIASIDARGTLAPLYL